MFQLTIERTFCAAHAIVIRGELEPTHGHNWVVTVGVSGEQLDADGLLCDFHLVEQHVDRLLAEFHNRNLNETPPFDEVNPTAEQIARHLGESLRPELPAGVALHHCSVTEAPGCRATYIPE